MGVFDAEISYTANKGRVDKTSINFMYVLTDEDGEMHKPKYANRVEMEMSQSVESSIREQMLSDALMMESQGYPMSAGWLRSMGEMDKASWVESLQKNMLASASSSAAQPGQKKKRKSEEYFDVEMILQERGRGRSKEYVMPIELTLRTPPSPPHLPRRKTTL